MQKQTRQREGVGKRKRSAIQMGAKVTNQINTNQQSNMVLSAYCAVTQSCSTVNINMA